jgi:hypothetical protein
MQAAKRHYNHEDRRTEPRVPSTGVARLTAVDARPGVKLEATIIDISRSGMKVEVSEPLDVATFVMLDLGNLTVLGSVGNCRPEGEGRFRLGIVTRQVIDPRS